MTLCPGATDQPLHHSSLAPPKTGLLGDPDQSWTHLSTLLAPELAVVDVPGQSVCPQHLMTFLVADHLVVGLVQSDPHLHMSSEFSVAESGVVCERLRSLSETKTPNAVFFRADVKVSFFSVSLT